MASDDFLEGASSDAPNFFLLKRRFFFLIRNRLQVLAVTPQEKIFALNQHKNKKTKIEAKNGENDTFLHLDIAEKLCYLHLRQAN